MSKSEGVERILKESESESENTRSTVDSKSRSMKLNFTGRFIQCDFNKTAGDWDVLMQPGAAPPSHCPYEHYKLPSSLTSALDVELN